MDSFRVGAEADFGLAADHPFAANSFLVGGGDQATGFPLAMAVFGVLAAILFYVTFGLIITLSVEMAGVLMVFAYLVAPAIISLRISSACFLLRASTFRRTLLGSIMEAMSMCRSAP